MTKHCYISCSDFFTLIFSEVLIFLLWFLEIHSLRRRFRVKAYWRTAGASLETLLEAQHYGEAAIDIHCVIFYWQVGDDGD